MVRVQAPWIRTLVLFFTPAADYLLDLQEPPRLHKYPILLLSDLPALSEFTVRILSADLLLANTGPVINAVPRAARVLLIEQLETYLKVSPNL